MDVEWPLPQLKSSGLGAVGSLAEVAWVSGPGPGSWGGSLGLRPSSADGSENESH